MLLWLMVHGHGSLLQRDPREPNSTARGECLEFEKLGSALVQPCLAKIDNRRSNSIRIRCKGTARFASKVQNTV